MQAVATSGDFRVVELLLHSGAPADPRDIFGRTPLMYAVLYDTVELAKLLIRRGAAAGGRDRTGRSAAQLAAGRRCGQDADLAVLLSRGA
jgi:uncharacterized protein